MPNASAYDWSRIDRDLLAEMVAFAKPAVVEKTLSPKEFTKKIRQLLHYFKIPVHVRTSYDSETTKNSVWVGGLYYAVADKLGMSSITVLLQFNPENKQKIAIKDHTNIHTKMITAQLWRLLYIHQGQREYLYILSGFSTLSFLALSSRSNSSSSSRLIRACTRGSR